MRLMNKILICFMLLVMTSCHTEINRFQEFILTHEQLNVSPDVEFIIIVPNQGCGGCITYMEDFYKNNKYNEKILFIFTNVISKKMLAYKIGEVGENTYIDYKNEFIKCYPEGKSIYPCVLEIKNNSVKNIYYQSPKEDGISIIRSKLKI
ncbi:MAG: hypothetical protein IKB31_03750 [Bacteroidaceae bacterium]|nr:hypothetical protein [Bacteroidaceae bacterium]